MIIAVYITGVIVNALIFLLFREVFYERGKFMGFFFPILALLSLLSFVLWIIVLTIIITEYLHSTRNNDDNGTN